MYLINDLKLNHDRIRLLHYASNILSTHIPKTKTIQPNYSNINHI